MKHSFYSSDTGRKLLTLHQPEQFAAIRMPYRGNTCSAIFLLPDSPSTPLADMAGSLDWTQLLSSGQGSAWSEVEGWRKLEVFIPRFKVKSQVSLTSALKSLGVLEAFSKGADFSRLSPVPLTISDVLHTVS